MAEFCVDCMRRECEEIGAYFSERDWIISKESDLCETCGEWKPVVIRRKRFRFICSKLRRNKS